MRVRSTLLAAVAALSVSVVAVQPAHAQAPRPRGVFLPAHPGAVLPTRNADVTSLNWSGYASLAPAGQLITEVTQHWTVVGAKVAPPGFSSTWAGIGGYNDTQLIQAGTESDSTGLIQAWWELLPDSETPITSGCVGDTTCKVVVGDKMFVDIKNVGGDNWTIFMQNTGKWTFTINLVYHTLQNSAEWILEAPTVGAQTTIAHVGTQKFTPGNTFTINGVTKNIGQGNPVRIILGAGLVNEATPSKLNLAGTAFNDCTYKNKCSAPA